MKHQRFVFVFLCLSFLPFAKGQQLKGDTWKSIKSTGSGEVTMTYNFSGEFIKKGPNGLEGLCYQIWQEFIKDTEKTHGVKIKQNIYYPADPIDFTAFYNSVQQGNGGVFGLADVTITEERKKEVSFSPSFFSNVSILLTNSAVADLNSMSNIASDFKGKTIIVQKGTTHETRAREIKATLFPTLKIEAVNSFQECYDKVNTNSNYFTYLDFSSYLTALKNTKNIKRHQAGDQTGENFGFIMPKGSDWEPVIAAFFNKDGGFINSTTYKKIVANTLGSNVVSMLNSIND
jgi:putative glutamine transport system substrate-binding protein